MAEKIYIMDEQQNLEPLEKYSFELEDHLQELIAEHPELLAGEQIRPDDPLRWILIKREQGIADTPGAADRWAVDLLLIDQDAVPTLVEVKLGKNTQVRREVVGQMLDYAAHATTTLAKEKEEESTIRRTFEQTSQNPDDDLANLLQDREPDADEFWKNVRKNLATKKIRLLFVADEIPDVLERVVTFLNEQMPNIEVLAVEIKRFSGESQRHMLVPRVIGLGVSTTTNQSPRNFMTPEEFYGRFDDLEARGTAERLLEAAQESGANLEWGASSVSIRGHCSLWNRPITVAWFYPPPAPIGYGLRAFVFGAELRDDHPDELSTFLNTWCNQFEGDDFSEDAQMNWARQYIVDNADAAKHIDVLCERLAKVLADLKAL